MDFKHKEINKQKEINAGAPQEQAEIKQYSLEEFLGADYAQLEQKEQNLQGDMAAGEALVQKKDILKDFEVIELPKEVKVKSLDETFEDAYKAAHIFEKKTSKMKKSTLKKRRAEYAQKSTEQKTMLDVKQKVNALKSGPTRDAIQKELTSLSVVVIAYINQTANTRPLITKGINILAFIRFISMNTRTPRPVSAIKSTPK